MYLCCVTIFMAKFFFADNDINLRNNLLKNGLFEAENQLHIIFLVHHEKSNGTFGQHSIIFFHVFFTFGSFSSRAVVTRSQVKKGEQFAFGSQIKFIVVIRK